MPDGFIVEKDRWAGAALLIALVNGAAYSVSAKGIAGGPRDVRAPGTKCKGPTSCLPPQRVVLELIFN